MFYWLSKEIRLDAKILRNSLEYSNAHCTIFPSVEGTCQHFWKWLSEIHLCVWSWLTYAVLFKIFEKFSWRRFFSLVQTIFLRIQIGQPIPPKPAFTGETVWDFRPLPLGSMQIFGTPGPMVPKIGIHFMPRNPVCSYCPPRETNWHPNLPNIFFCSLNIFLQKTYKAWSPNITFLMVKIYNQNLWYPIFGTRGKYGVKKRMKKLT